MILRNFYKLISYRIKPLIAQNCVAHAKDAGEYVTYRKIKMQSLEIKFGGKFGVMQFCYITYSNSM